MLYHRSAHSKTMKIPQLIKTVAVYEKNRSKIGLFRCECGNVFHAHENLVKRGNTKSCGCNGGRRSVISMSLGHVQPSYWHWLDSTK